jgi:quercetin dioxygenase-like cupin family protein
MKWSYCVLVAALAGTGALAADEPRQSGQQLLSTQQTVSGQPIVAPSGPMQVTATLAELKPGESTPLHKHPYLRYDYVLEGRISVKNFVTGKVDVVSAGQFVVDPIDQWHQGTAMDGKPVRLLIIDQTPIGKSNLVNKDQAPAK